MSKTYLALDYGAKRTGLAVGNEITRTSQALPAILTRQFEGADGKLSTGPLGAIIKTWQIDHLVFGEPLDADGAPTVISKRIRKLGGKLGILCALPVSFADERYSSSTADLILREQHQRGKKMTAKKVALRDSIAAQLILEAYFFSTPDKP